MNGIFLEGFGTTTETFKQGNGPQGQDLNLGTPRTNQVTTHIRYSVHTYVFPRYNATQMRTTRRRL